MTDEVKPVNYDTMTKDQLLEALGQAYAAKDFKLMTKLSTLVAKAEAAEERAKKDALAEELEARTKVVKAAVMKALTPMYDAGKLDGADGVWLAWDFGQGNLVEVRLQKAARRTSGEGGSTSGSSGYVPNPAKTKDLLATHGGEVMFLDKEGTPVAAKVTIAHVEHDIPVGFTFNEADKLSTDNGWRNRVRMALLKRAGLIG